VIRFPLTTHCWALLQALRALHGSRRVRVGRAQLRGGVSRVSAHREVLLQALCALRGRGRVQAGLAQLQLRGRQLRARGLRGLLRRGARRAQPARLRGAGSGAGGWPERMEACDAALLRLVTVCEWRR
jgi:hypothetical protein